MKLYPYLEGIEARGDESNVWNLAPALDHVVAPNGREDDNQ